MDQHPEEREIVGSLFEEKQGEKTFGTFTGIILAGCATFVPYQPQKLEVNINDDTEAFGAAIDCASKAVRPPSTGTMFTYQSEKYNKFILTYLMDSGSDPWYGTPFPTRQDPPYNRLSSAV